MRLGLVLALTSLAAPACENSPAASPDGSVPDAGSPDAFTLEDFPGVDGFGEAHMITQGYWYSRYNLGSLVMKSGLGETFMPDPTMVQAMVDMTSDTLSTSAPPGNPALLKRVFNQGDPAYVTAHDTEPMDFADERWAPVTATPTTGAAFGWTLIKEVEWAKQFHVDAHFGVVGQNDIPGAMERFAGLALYAEAVMQAMELMGAPASFSFATVEDAYVALAALADLSIVTAPDALPGSASNRYKAAAAMMAEAMGMPGADMAAMFAGAADDMYPSLPSPTTARDRALAIQALALYGKASPTNRAAVRTRIGETGDALAAAPPASSLERAEVLAGLVSATRAVGARPAWDTAMADAFDGLLGAYDGRAALFDDLDTYTAGDIATLLRALNGASLYAAGVDPELALHMQRDLFENLVDVSGLQISAPPIEEIADYERLPNAAGVEPLFHRYPMTPTPEAAGGSFGRAPVFAASVTVDRAAGTWTADRTTFDAAAGMRLANEMLWFHSDEVDGFPEIP